MGGGKAEQTERLAFMQSVARDLFLYILGFLLVVSVIVLLQDLVSRLRRHKMKKLLLVPLIASVFSCVDRSESVIKKYTELRLMTQKDIERFFYKDEVYRANRAYRSDPDYERTCQKESKEIKKAVLELCNYPSGRFAFMCENLEIKNCAYEKEISTEDFLRLKSVLIDLGFKPVRDCRETVDFSQTGSGVLGPKLTAYEAYAITPCFIYSKEKLRAYLSNPVDAEAKIEILMEVGK